MQLPATQDMPVPHAFPQTPQLFESVRVFTSQPSAAMALQLA